MAWLIQKHKKKDQRWEGLDASKTQELKGGEGCLIAPKTQGPKVGMVF